MSYSDVTGHRSMVFDAMRNAAYARALARVVQPGTTVMDLGAGLGVHGFYAAKLGAAAVHLVEPSPVLDIARGIAETNGLTNVLYHPCRVEELQLDQRVDVMVSVFTGNLLLTEDLLPSLFYARDKFLAPGGHMIPDRGRIEVVPVCAADYYRKHIEAWGDHVGKAGLRGEPELDYRIVRSFAANSLYYDTRNNFKAIRLAAPAALIDMDFTTASRAECDSEVEVEVQQSGSCHGWLGWFQIRLGEEWFSTSGEFDNTHWRPVFLPLERPLEVKAGDRLGFALKRPEFGEWTWTTRYAGTRHRQSTFLAKSLSHDRLRRASEYYHPRLNRRGEAARWLLAQMSGMIAVKQLSKELYKRYPELYKSEDEASRFVKDLVGDFCES